MSVQDLPWLLAAGAAALVVVALLMLLWSSVGVSVIRAVKLENRAAKLLHLEGRPDLAEPLLKRAVKLAERAGEKNPNLAPILANLAELYRATGHKDMSEPLYRRAIEINELHPDSTTYALMPLILEGFGNLLRDTGRKAEADEVEARARRIEEELGPEGLPEKHYEGRIGLDGKLVTTVEGFLELGSHSLEQGDLEGAEDNLCKALELEEDRVGPDDLALARILNALAGVCFDQGKIDEAGMHSQRALKICEAKLGPEAGEVAVCLNNLGHIYTHLEKFEEAESLIKRAASVWEEAEGAIGRDVVYALDNLAKLMLATARLPEAEFHLTKAEEILSSSFDPDAPELLDNLESQANVFMAQEKFVDAERAVRRLISIRNKDPEGSGPSLGGDMLRLSEILAHLDRHDEAIASAKESLSLHESILGPDHMLVGESLYYLALRYLEAEDYAEAKPFIERAMDIGRRQMDPNDPNMALVLAAMARIHAAEGKLDQAETNLEEAQGIIERTLGSHSPILAGNLCFQAELHRMQGRFDEANSLEAKADMIEKLSGTTGETLN